MKRTRKTKANEPQAVEVIQPDNTIIKSGEGGFSEINIGGFTDISGLAFAGGYRPSETGYPVGPIDALQLSPCYAAIRALADDIGALPLILHEHTKPRGSAVVTDHPILDLLDSPNGWQTREELITNLVYNLVLAGNAYIFIQRTNDGTPCQLIPVSPYQCQVLIDQGGTGELFYSFAHPMYPNEIFACGSESMIHVRNSITTPGGVFGYSPIELGRQVLGIGVAVQRTAAVFFANGAQLRGLLSVTGKLSPEAAKNLRQSWQAAYGSAQNAAGTAVLGDGATFTPISQNADEAQLLESRKFSVEEIARWFRIPPHKIGEMGRANFSNVVELNKSYVTDCLTPLCTKIETALIRKLFLDRSDRKRYFFRFDFGEMLRAKELEQMQTVQLGRMTGILTQNEARAEINRNPVPGGDTFLSPLNMTITGKPDGATDMAIQYNPDSDADVSPDINEDLDT